MKVGFLESQEGLQSGHLSVWSSLLQGECLEAGNMGAGLRLGVCWLSGPGKVKRSELHVIYMFNESQSCSTWFKVRIRDKQTIINSINRRLLSLSLTVYPSVSLAHFGVGSLLTL